MLDTFSLGWAGGKMRKQNMGGHQAKMAKIEMTIVYKLRATLSTQTVIPFMSG